MCAEIGEMMEVGSVQCERSTGAGPTGSGRLITDSGATLFWSVGRLVSTRLS